MHLNQASLREHNPSIQNPVIKRNGSIDHCCRLGHRGVKNNPCRELRPSEIETHIFLSFVRSYINSAHCDEPWLNFAKINCDAICNQLKIEKLPGMVRIEGIGINRPFQEEEQQQEQEEQENEYRYGMGYSSPNDDIFLEYRNTREEDDTGSEEEIQEEEEEGEVQEEEEIVESQVIDEEMLNDWIEKDEERKKKVRENLNKKRKKEEKNEEQVGEENEEDNEKDQTYEEMWTEIKKEFIDVSFEELNASGFVSRMIHPGYKLRTKKAMRNAIIIMEENRKRKKSENLELIN